MIFTTLLNIAIFQGIVFGIIILKSPIFKNNASKYLAYAIFTLSLLLLNYVFELLEIYKTIPLLHIIDDIEWALIFPVFVFLFVVHQVKHPILKSKKIRLLFVPFLYSALLSLYIDLDKVVGLYEIPNAIIPITEFLSFMKIFIIPLFVIGIPIYTYTFIKYSKDKLEKKWITIVLAFVFIILFTWIVAVLIGIFFGYDLSFFLEFVAIFATFWIHWTAYFGIFKYRLAKDKEGINALLTKKFPSTEMEPDIEANAKKGNLVSNIESFTKDNPYFKELEALCNNHQIYRDSNLNREIVAEKLGISAGYLSQLVNTITEKNFANYINHYRVEAVKEMVLDSEFKNYNLLAMGLESGFTSKTTFYNAFKKATGMTPNTYRNSHK